MVYLAVVLPLAMGLAGLGVDAAQLYMTHSRLQGAVDAAALAASLQLPWDPDLDKGLSRAAAADYLSRNLPEARMQSVAPGTETRSVTVTAEAEAPLALLHILGVTPKTVTATATAGFNNLEVVFVIDNSGSMKGSPINETNEAARALSDLLIPDGTHPAVKIGLVPFRGMVRIHSGVDGLAAGCRNADGSFNDGLDPEYRKPEYRNPPDRYLNVSSSTCEAIPFTHALTDDKAAIKSAISEQDALGSGSGTVISEGIKWARHLLTPAPPFTEADGDERMRKIIILLTDGDTEDGNCGGRYASWYTPNNYWTNAYYGMLDTESHCDDGGILNRDMLAQAQAAKDAGIEIFTIRYGVSDSVDVDLMRAASSSEPGTDDHFFDAPSAYDIADVFRLIGRQLGWRLLD